MPLRGDRGAALTVTEWGDVTSVAGLGRAAAVALATDPSRVGTQMRWAVGLLTGDTEFDSGDAGRFVDAFVRKHPAGIGPLIEGWRAAGPYRLEAYDSVAHRAWAGLVDATGTPMTLAAVVDSPGQLRILALLPERAVPPVTSWDGVEQALLAPGVELSLLVAGRHHDGWQTLHARHPDRSMPSGSTYKLFVLHAVATAVAGGELAWTERLTVSAHQRSLPTGELQDWPAGTDCSVAEATHRMIAMSDNTAADLLLDRLGREAVERAVEQLGHHDPAVLVPFPASRELFQIGWGDRELRAAWTAAGEDGRRRLLDQVARTPITVGTADMLDAVHPAGLDWYLSAWDVARALDGLRADADRDRDGVLWSALAANTGVVVDPDRWRRVAFKAGSSPGALSLCWLLERRHESFVVVVQQSSAQPELLRDSWYSLRVVRNALHDLLP